MDIAEDNIIVKSPNVINMNAVKASKQKMPPLYDKMKLSDNLKREVTDMMPDKAKNNDQFYTKSEIDLKFQIIDNKIDSTADKIISKTENMFANLRAEIKSDFANSALQLQELKTQMAEEKLSNLKESQQTKREFTYWFIGLLVSSIIGIAAIIATILSTK